MSDALNISLMLITIVLGGIGWLAPDYTMRKLRLALAEGSTVGKSEIRAANGCLFVGIGLAAILLDQPLGYAMVGFAYAGAAVGRLTSIVLDRSGEFITYSFVAAEIALAVVLLWVNLGGSGSGS